MRKFSLNNLTIAGTITFLAVIVFLFAGIIVYLSHKEAEPKNYINFGEALFLSFICISCTFIFQLIFRGVLYIIFDFEEFKDFFINIPNSFINLKTNFKIKKLNKINRVLTENIVKLESSKKFFSEKIEKELKCELSETGQEALVNTFLFKIDEIDFKINDLRLSIENNEHKVTVLVLKIRSVSSYVSNEDAIRSELQRQRNKFQLAKANLEQVRVKLQNSINVSV